jgi:tetratricopeptide (TPR) repeat protein
MRIVVYLSDLALRQLPGESAGAVLGFLRDRFSDRGRRLLEALRTSQARAWRALEIALAGPSWWDSLRAVLVRREEQELGREIRSFLDAAPLPELAGKTHFRRQCLKELQESRRRGLLDGTLSAAELEAKASARLRHADAQAVQLAEWQALEGLAGELEGQGCKGLAWLLRQRPTGGPPLLALAVRYFFRRAVEDDAELARGLTFSQLDTLSLTQSTGFADLHAALAAHGRRLEQMLEGLVQAVQEIRGGVAAVGARVPQLGEQFQAGHNELLRLVTDMLRQMQMDARPLRPGDSRSLQTDHERGRVQALVRQYHSLPEAQRRATPRLLEGLGKLQVAAGDFEGARRDFEAAAAAAGDPREQAESYFNAYRAALEGGRLDDALAALQEALARDAERFAPFPLDEYAPQRILGAGGFGVTFLCRSQMLGSRLAVKALTPVEQGRQAVKTVFREAITLAQLHHPGIIQLRHWGYADDAKTRPYVVMEYFEAPTLDGHVREHGPLAFADFKEVARAMGEALRAAHARGIVHRDVKPANLLLRRGEKDWEVRLIDFGLALSREAVDTGSTVRNAGVTGTLDYAAPEQLGRLPGVAVGPAADVYGFGRTCCYALFGTPNPRPQHWQEATPSLAALLGDCLAEDPAQRPAGFEAVLERLAKVRAPQRRKGAAAEEAEAPVPPRLVVVRGVRPGVEYSLREGANVIGRGDEAPVDVDLGDQEAEGRVLSSRRHALLACKEGRLALTDLHSANGTFVNRTRLAPGQEHPLQAGDVVQVGTVQLRVASGG